VGIRIESARDQRPFVLRFETECARPGVYSAFALNRPRIGALTLPGSLKLFPASLCDIAIGNKWSHDAK